MLAPGVGQGRLEKKKKTLTPTMEAVMQIKFKRDVCEAPGPAKYKPR